MSTLRTDRGKAKIAIPVRRAEREVRFSARSTWISPRMRLSSLIGSSVSILICFLIYSLSFLLLVKCQHDFSETRVGFHTFMRIADFICGKNPVDDRTN